MTAELSLQIAGGPDAPAEARAALRRMYPDLPIEVVQVMVLLTSELVSNAVKHADADPIAVRSELRPDAVRVEVLDEGPGFTHQPRRLGPTDVGGWGLHLVDELSSRWGVADDEGARVWFEIDR